MVIILQTFVLKKLGFRTAVSWFFSLKESREGNENGSQILGPVYVISIGIQQTFNDIVLIQVYQNNTYDGSKFVARIYTIQD